MEAHTGIPHWIPLHRSTVVSTVEPTAQFTVQHAFWIVWGSCYLLSLEGRLHYPIKSNAESTVEYPIEPTVESTKQCTQYSAQVLELTLESHSGAPHCNTAVKPILGVPNRTAHLKPTADLHRGPTLWASCCP